MKGESKGDKEVKKKKIENNNNNNNNNNDEKGIERVRWRGEEIKNDEYHHTGKDEERMKSKKKFEEDKASDVVLQM